MSEWDKLWEGLRAEAAYSRIGRGVGKNWLDQVRAVGDKLQQENKDLKCKSNYCVHIEKLEAIRKLLLLHKDHREHPDYTLVGISWKEFNEILEVLGK